MTMPYMIVPAQGSDPADEWMRLGVQAHVEGRLPEAQNKYQQALRVDPRHASATQNLAIIFAQSSLMNDALLTIERAAIYGPSNEIISRNWALIASEAGRIDVALDKATLAVDQKPNPDTWLALALVSAQAGRPGDAIPLYNFILDKEPNHPMAGPNCCFVQTLVNSTPEQLLKQRQRFYEGQRYKGEKVELFPNNLNTDRPLRVGYVSGDFKCHSAAFIFSGVVLRHSKAVEPYFYSTIAVDPEKDYRTKQFGVAAGAEHQLVSKNADGSSNYALKGGRWRDISTLTDEQAEQMIRKDRIDILVDLSAHTGGGRLALFTRKPAPVQVTAWGFAHGTGIPEIDYFFADPITVREEERQFYAEKIWDLPCIVTLDPMTEYNLQGTSRPPIRKNGYFTFGAYARYEKMSEDCIKTFAEILKQVPDSKLEFKDPAYSRPYSIKRIMGLMPDIEPDRLLFSIGTSHTDHMLAYQQADLILDPFPHTGGVVCLEQLYMGVPLITLYGPQAGCRTTTSVLGAMGRTDWLARNTEEYIAKAVEWSDRLKELAEARKTLRDELLNSPVVKGYVEAVETAYQQMWKKWVEG